LKYSTFALPDYESENQPRAAVPDARLQRCQFELLNYDEDLLSRSIAVKALPVASQRSRVDGRHQIAGNRNREAAEFWPANMST